MANPNKITKKQFDAVYNKHLPSKWIKFAYKYFSTETEKGDMKLKSFIIYFLLGVFFIGFFGTMFNFSRTMILIPTTIYSIVLVVLVLYIFSAIILNNIRIGKICKELGITKIQYNLLLNIFYS